MVNRYGTTNDWGSEQLKSDDLVDTLGALRWYPFKGKDLGTTDVVTGVIGHSASIFSMVTTAGEVFTSTDTGVTWTSKSTVPDTRSIIRVCKADKTHGVVVETGTTAEVVFTDTSGTTWSAKTSASFGTGVYDVAFSTAALIVIGGDDAAGTAHIVFSTDDGTTWTDATTSPDTRVYAVDMFSATVGYAIDSAGKIWKTINAAVTWTDTLHVIKGTAGTNSSIYAVSATVCIIAVSSFLEYYDNTAGTVTIKVDVGATNYNMSLGIVKNDTGYYYAGISSDNRDFHPFLLRSTDIGVSWEIANYSGLSGDTVTPKCALGTGTTDLLFTPDNSCNGFIIFPERQD